MVVNDDQMENGYPTHYGVSVVSTYALGFMDQCLKHDGHNFHCQILQAFAMDEIGVLRAIQFYDDEMTATYDLSVRNLLK